MKITGIFTFNNGTKVVSGISPWNDNLRHKPNDILVCGDKQWKVIEVAKIFQGCFMSPDTRQHELKLQPINHNDMPNEGDILTRKE
jgi:hypothetical protein